ncbi:hypothetical protein ABVK43_25050, partial [Mycobacterium kansasii]
MVLMGADADSAAFAGVLAGVGAAYVSAAGEHAAARGATNAATAGVATTDSAATVSAAGQTAAGAAPHSALGQPTATAIAASDTGGLQPVDQRHRPPHGNPPNPSDWNAVQAYNQEAWYYNSLKAQLERQLDAANAQYTP